MGSNFTERLRCSQICPGCHILPTKGGTNNFRVTCDHAENLEDEYVGTIPALDGTTDPDTGLIVELACLVPEKKMKSV